MTSKKENNQLESNVAQTCLKLLKKTLRVLFVNFHITMNE